MINSKIKFPAYILSGFLFTNVLYGATDPSLYKSGAYTGALLGYSLMNSTIKEDNLIPLFPVSINGTGKSHQSNNGIVGDFLLGYRHFFENQFLLGAELDFSLDNNEVTQTTHGLGTGSKSKTKYKAPFKFTPALVFGKQFNQKLLGFIKLGMSIAQFKGSHTLISRGAPGAISNFRTTRNGFMGAIGAEYALSNTFSTVGILAYECFSKFHNSYEDPSGMGLPGSSNAASIKPEYVTAKIGIVYRF